MRSRAYLLLGLMAPLVSGCPSGIAPADGLQAGLRLPPPATYMAGNPKVVDGGLAVSAARDLQVSVVLGGVNFPVSGELPSAAVAVAFQLQGDIGYWTLPAGANDDFSAPNTLSFSTRLSFNPGITVPDSGMITVNVYAVDANGDVGPSTPIAIKIQPTSPIGAALVISLTWDTESDLDLHVIQPDGGEIWSQKRRTTKSTNPSVGFLDFDSNPECAIDGRREENVIFRAGTADGGAFPPPGQYLVRVDTWSLCGKGFANWNVNTYLRGSLISSSFGEALPTDTRFAHGAGAGVTVQTFAIAMDGGLAP